MKVLALTLASILSGCIGVVHARPPIFCMEVVAPTLQCDANYVWLPGYWGWDGWGQRIWIPGRYTPRYPNVRDHRR